MLQEDFSAPIVSQACLLSTFKYAVSMPQTDPEEWVSEAERVRDLELAEQEKEMMAAAGLFTNSFFLFPFCKKSLIYWRANQ